MYYNKGRGEKQNTCTGPQWKRDREKESTRAEKNNNFETIQLRIVNTKESAWIWTWSVYLSLSHSLSLSMCQLHLSLDASKVCVCAFLSISVAFFRDESECERTVNRSIWEVCGIHHKPNTRIHRTQHSWDINSNDIRDRS